MTEKQQKKAFNRNIQYFKTHQRDYVDVVKKRQNEIMRAIPEPEENDNEGFEKFELQMRQYMEALIVKEKQTDLVELEKRQEAYARILTDIEALAKSIAAGQKLWDAEGNESGWGGAGIIVTSDPAEASNHEDFVVITKYPVPIVWTMNTLRDVGAEYINYLNKEEFYWTLAKTAKTFLETHGDHEMYHGEMIGEMLKQVMSLIQAEKNKLKTRGNQIASEMV